jgi:hypothetical protein
VIPFFGGSGGPGSALLIIGGSPGTFQSPEWGRGGAGWSRLLIVVLFQTKEDSGLGGDYMATGLPQFVAGELAAGAADPVLVLAFVAFLTRWARSTPTPKLYRSRFGCGTETV